MTDTNESPLGAGNTEGNTGSIDCQQADDCTKGNTPQLPVYSGLTCYAFGETGHIAHIERSSPEAMTAGLRAYLEHHDIYRVMGVLNASSKRVPTKEQMAGALMAWAEFDPTESVWKEGSKDFSKLDLWRKDMIAKLQAYEFPPSRIIDSGRGLWAEWWLNELADPDLVEGINYGLGKAIGGADNCWNVNRIGRMPGTVNHKTGRRAEVVAEAGHTYSAENLPFEKPPASARTDRVIDADAVEPDGDLVDAVAALPIHPDARAAVLYGHNADSPPKTPWGEDRSDMLFFFLCECVRNKVDDGVVLGLCKAGATKAFVKGGFGTLYNHRRGKFAGQLKRHPERDARRQLANAYDRVAKDEEKFDNGTLDQPPPAKPPERIRWRRLTEAPHPVPDPEYVVRDFIERGIVTMILARGAVGKSLFAIQSANAWARGESFLGLVPEKPLTIAILNCEDDLLELSRRVDATMQERHPNILVPDIDRLTLMTADPEGKGPPKVTSLYNELDQAIAEMGIDLLVLDPLIEMHEGMDENTADMKHLGIAVRNLARKHNIGVLMVHHPKKGGQAGDQDNSRGHSSLINLIRAQHIFEPMTPAEHGTLKMPPDKSHKSFFRIVTPKANYGPAVDFGGTIHDRWVEKVMRPGAIRPHLMVANLTPQILPDTKSEDIPQFKEFVALVQAGSPDGELWRVNKRGKFKLEEVAHERFGFTSRELIDLLVRAEAAGLIVRGRAYVKRKAADEMPMAYAAPGDQRLYVQEKLDV